MGLIHYLLSLLNVLLVLLTNKRENMTSIIYKNELLKRKFYKYLQTSRGLSDESIKRYENSIWIWENFTNKADFNSFNMTKAEEFKDWLKNKKKKNSQKNICLSYCYDNLRHLQTFFEWLFDQPNHKSKMKQLAVKFLNLTKKETREATQPRSIKYPTLEEIKKVIENIKGETEVDMRDKALLSLTALTGARISAIRMLPMKSFDKENLIIYQGAEFGVNTKFSNRIASVLISFGYKEALDYFLKWFNYLEREKEFGPDDPIFPATKIENGKNNVCYYSTGKIEAKFLKTSISLGQIFKKRFNQAGINYYHPHTFRHFWVKEISKLLLTEEEKKAISQNLGHKNVGTTFGSSGYGKIEEDRQIEIIKNIDFGGRNKETKIYITLEDAKQLLKDNNNQP